MERSLLWGACALGGAGFLCGLLLGARRAGEPRAGAALPGFAFVAAALLPILVFAATLPSSPPFSPGQGWGRGFLLGGLAAWLAAWAALRAGEGAPGRAAAAAAPCWTALAAVAVTLLLAGRDGVIDHLLGVAIGGLVVTFVLAQGAGGAAPILPLLLGAGYAATLCAVAALGVYRDGLSPELARGTWSALAATLAAGVPFALLVGGALPLRPGARAGDALRVLLPLAVFVAVAAALSIKVIPETKILLVAVVGPALGLVAWWTFHDAHARSDGENGEPAPFWTPPLALALLLGGFMASFQMLQGFGTGLMLLGAALPAGLAWIAAGAKPEREARSGAPAAIAADLTRLLLAGVVLLLYRLFAARFAPDLRGVTLTDHYALFGFLLGAILPGLLAVPLRPVGRGLALLPVGAAALAAPAVIVLLWGLKCALALLGGLALGAAGAFEAGRARSNETPLARMLPALLAVAVALALAQWAGHVLPLADMTRAAKIRVLAGAVAALVALVAVSGYVARLRGVRGIFR